MYTLEFYDKIRDIERQYHFSHPISPQQALDIFSKMLWADWVAKMILSFDIPNLIIKF